MARSDNTECGWPKNEYVTFTTFLWTQTDSDHKHMPSRIIIGRAWGWLFLNFSIAVRYVEHVQFHKFVHNIMHYFMNTCSVFLTTGTF